MIALAPPRVFIDTATGVKLSLTLAGPGARIFAFAIDWHIRTVLALTWYALAAMRYNGSLGDFSPPVDPGAVWFGWVVLPAAGIYFLYHWVLEIAMRGATPGKRIAGVRLVTRMGTMPTLAAYLTRNVFRLIDCFPVFYGLGLFLTLRTRNHLRLGDLAAGTLLVYDLPLDAPDRDGLNVSGLERAAAWQDAAARARRLMQGRGVRDFGDATAMMEDYRLLAHDVARARRSTPQSTTREFLEAAFAQAHAALHHSATHPRYALWGFFRDQLPQVTRDLRKHILWVTLLFVLAIFAGHWLVTTYPALIALFASPDLIATVERGDLWTEGLLNVVPSSVLSLQILSNNIIVSLFAYCAGFLFGLGTLYIVGLNGFMIGAVYAFTAQYGLDDDLFRFMIAHGPVELSVMCLSGAAGASVGEALIRPNSPRRAEAFQDAAVRSGKLLIACVLLLVGCGFIEGFISPNPTFPLWTRAVVGAGYWLFMVAVLRGWLFGRSRSPVPLGA